jgi:hypothetical protein
MEGTGKFPIAECSEISVRFYSRYLRKVLSVFLPRNILPIAHHNLLVKVKILQCCALLQMICSAMIITALSVLSYPTSRNQSHKFTSGKRGGQNPCILHCHPKIVCKIAWDVVKVIPLFCGVTLSQYSILCHTFFSFVTV